MHLASKKIDARRMVRQRVLTLNGLDHCPVPLQVVHEI